MGSETPKPKFPSYRMKRICMVEIMKVSEEEIRRIKEDIQKSGFPLEIEVSSKLREDGWTVIIHDYYIDEEEGKSREIDVEAFKRLEINSPDYDFFHVSLIIECKKSLEKPWVFYTTQKGREFKFPQSIIKSLGKPRIHKKLISQERWMKGSHYFSPRFKKKAIIGYEPFTEGKGQRIFEASMQVIKALAYMMKQTEQAAETLSVMNKNPLFIMYPVIVLDGHLFEYTLKEEVKPIMYLQYLVRHRFTNPLTSELVGDVFLIDVLRKDFLPEYLKILEEELNIVKNKLISWTD